MRRQTATEFCAPYGARFDMQSDEIRQNENDELPFVRWSYLMLIGTFLRDYKNYNSLVYVPIARTPQEMLTLYTGVNGVGKSAILEALNCFFNANAAQWNLRKGGKQEEALVAPVFLIPKSDDPSNEAMIKADEQWRKLESDPDVKSRAPAIEALVKHRESMGNLDEFYFFAVGYTAYSNYGEPISRIKSLMKALHLPDEKVLPYDTGQLLETVRSYYDYAYLPVESTAQDITNLQTLELQRIMGRTVSTELKKIFTGKEANAQSLLDRINSKLSSYMESINDEIKTIDSRYKYKTDQGVPGKLKAEELCQHILEQFIERRALKRDTVKISELSSGEQRQVLMDVLYAFLASDKAKGRHIILAIDEPEASLHMSKCFDQFRRASRLANEFRHQVLLTTHWYGFLPLSQEGVFHHLNNEDSKISFTSHSLRASIGDRGNFPDDVNLKSYFDFVSSILSA
jgi:predicted ATPase